MPSFKKISIIGAGHLGRALALGLIKTGRSAETIAVSNRNQSKLLQLVKESGVLPAETNSKAVENADIVILAVQPQHMLAVCKEISEMVQVNKPLIISLAGIISVEHIAHWLGVSNLSIVRVMTNTPIEFCKGSSALFSNDFVTPAQVQWVEDLFNKVGHAFWVEEEEMLNTLTAPVGCSPAYVFSFLEAFQDAAITRGIPKEIATQIALNAVLGAAELAKHSGRSFAELRNAVSTPNGVTAVSLKTSPRFFHDLTQIFIAAEDRVHEISKSVNKPISKL